MTKFLILMSLCSVALLQACDIKDPINKPKTLARNVIIAGMPVYDHDYTLAKVHSSSIKPPAVGEQSLNELGD